MPPWSDVDELKIQTLKEYYHGRKLLKRLPKQFLEFEQYILSLDYTTDPNYQYLIYLLNQAAEEKEINLNDPFECEEEIKSYHSYNELLNAQYIKGVVKFKNISARNLKKIDLIGKSALMTQRWDIMN
ncbi:MAG: hypothetical protein EZS28_014082 [Streblomastix strix]|uniref:Uncharacterized protein n=1 Tax=Streblomastix strix TaxID=222440 RepID=A0A5J4W789_9EUKA|nr:MAG: hypothetical protein EZS28_014082 [Streblomastix strix]